MKKLGIGLMALMFVCTAWTANTHESLIIEGEHKEIGFELSEFDGTRTLEMNYKDVFSQLDKTSMEKEITEKTCVLSELLNVRFAYSNVDNIGVSTFELNSDGTFRYLKGAKACCQISGTYEINLTEIAFSSPNGDFIGEFVDEKRTSFKITKDVFGNMNIGKMYRLSEVDGNLS